MSNHDRGQLLELYKLVLDSEDRYQNRTESRSRFYQVTASALLGAGIIALVRALSAFDSFSTNNSLLVGGTIQAIGILAACVSIWSLPGIYRVYRRSVWEAEKRLKIEMALGLAPGFPEVPVWPTGFEHIGKEHQYLVIRQNLGQSGKPANLLDPINVDKRALSGVYGWSSLVFYILALLGVLLSGVASAFHPYLVVSFIIEFLCLILLWTWTYHAIRGRMKSSTISSSRSS